MLLKQAYISKVLLLNKISEHKQFVKNTFYTFERGTQNEYIHKYLSVKKKI